MITSDLYHYICLSFLCLGLVLIPFAQYWCWKWRRYKPLNGRPFFFVVWFNSILFVLLSVCIAFTFVILYDYNTYTASLRIVRPIEWIIVPLYFHCYAWRGWHLFFIFNLTEYRMKLQMEGKEPDNSNWFHNHKHYITKRNLVKSFVIFNCVFSVISVSIGAALEVTLSGATASNVYMALVCIYIVGLLLLAFLIRNVRDDYLLKKEITGVGIWWLVMLVVIAVISSQIANSIFGIIGTSLTGTFFISTVMPLLKAREYVRWESKTNSTTDDDSSSNFETSGTSRTSSKTIALSRVSSSEHVDYKSLESVMQEPKLLEIFSLFVGKHFKVEMIYFLLQLDVFKKMEPAGLAGKALLMYQKFIKPDSFLNLDLPPEIVAEIEEVVLNEDKLLESNAVTQGFFSKVEDLCTSELNNLLKEWRKSEEYEKAIQRLRERDKLNVGLSQSTSEGLV